MNDINRQVANAIDKNGDQPWVWDEERDCTKTWRGYCPGEKCVGCNDYNVVERIPLPFSTDPAAFGMLVEYCWNNGWRIEIDGTFKGCFIVTCRGRVGVENPNFKQAFCLAFLAAKGEK